MSALAKLWDHLEETMIVFLLVTMTLVTFAYVVFNNFYMLFYYLADSVDDGAMQEVFFWIGDLIMGGAQAMSWSNALTKALFAWLLFFGIAYGVRIGGHIGVDALVTRFSRPVQRLLGLIAVAVCLGYSGLMAVASYNWVDALMTANIGADDLGKFGIKQWHINMIVPLSFTLVFFRFVEILVRIVRDEQTGLGLADETADAMKLVETKE